jgi:hypothetical protein
MDRYQYKKMFNRTLLIVRLRQLFVYWINEAYPYPDSSHISVEFGRDSLLMAL